MNQFPNYISDGEPVSAGVANRAPREIQSNVNYVFGLLSASGLLSTQIIPQVPLSADCKVGQPVYLDPQLKIYKPALAAANLTGGVVELAASAQHWGVVYKKASSTVGDLLVSGYATLDLSAALSESVRAGVYYLSSVTPGRLVPTRQPVNIPVLRADGQGRVLVIPSIPDILDRHTHYTFPLVCLPAGRANLPSLGGTHSISNVDSELPGWLPASDPSFGGLAPAGAVFGYNLNAHPDLKAVWPPVPASEASLVWNKGQDTVGATGVPLGPNGLCVIDSNGIWWLSDCYGDVPWPIRISQTGYSLSMSDPTGSECPRMVQMEMILSFAKVSYATDATVVTSLYSTNNKLQVKCANGADGYAGALRLELDTSTTYVENSAGYQVIKSLDDGTAQRGPIVEGIYSSSPLVTLQGSARRRKIADDVTSPFVYQGLVEIAVADQSSLELPIQNYRLNGAEQDFYEDTIYFGFPAGMATDVRGQINVPAITSFSSPTLSISLRILARAAGNLPNLTVTARRIPAPVSGGSAALPLAASEFNVTITTSATIASANRYIEVTSTPFAVAAGDIVMFTVSRSASDGYAGKVGLLRSAGILAAG